MVNRKRRRFIIALMSVAVLLLVYLVTVVILPSSRKKSNGNNDKQHLSDDYGNDELVTMSVNLSNCCVVVDGGHGGADPGKVGLDGVLEKDVNLAIAMKLKKQLEDSQIKVVMTRESDDALCLDEDKNKKKADLNNRCDIINNSGADMVICIHQNSYPSPKVSGAQVFYYKKSEEGKKIATFVQKAIKENLGSDRQIKSDVSYYMLLHNDVPTIIVECGFLSNADEAKKLATEEYQEEVAKTLKLGIVDYLMNK